MRLGWHAIVDVSGADGSIGEAGAALLLAEITKACGSTLLRTVIHRFGEGQGLTAIAILAESHISLHEWPEHRFVAFDMFVCGSADPHPAVELIRSRYPGARVDARVFPRASQ